MNRQELIEIVAAQTEQSQRAVDRMLAALINTIQDTVAGGEKVSIQGFGTFEPKHQQARTGRNIATGDPVEIPATIKPRFKPGVNFRKIVAPGSFPEQISE
ncbi:HU family DNA-binding protein [Bordetella flabilis]|uniref:DNA-binding protein n=1 Tax=Bordetella flabilis TaxID=463014 RepID=A0A193GN03_9BORD|nr:HU family DNA-binding protein [Bordetella flabilis]ANN80876.1 hypothetical protein BAU07_26510 [Bordetella flabilis]